MKFEIVGKNLTDAEREKVEVSVERHRREKMGIQPGEIQKTPEQIRLIGKLNDYLEAEQKEAGIENTVSTTPEEIHYFKTTPLDEVFYGASRRGYAMPAIQFAAIHLSSGISLPEVCEVTLHEMAHLVSRTKIQVDRDPEIPSWFKPDNVNYHAYATGHSMDNSGGGRREDSHRHFIGLDEGIIQKMTVEIIEKRWEELKKDFGFRDEDKEKLFKSYRKLVGVLELVIRGVARNEKKEEDAIWKNFKKAEFVGGLSHLRSVERAFGRGAIRILAALPNPHLGKVAKSKSGTHPDMPMKKTRELIEQFFQERDPNMRDKIAAELLVKREHIKYTKRQERGGR